MSINLNQFDETTKKHIESWLKGSYDQDTKNEIIRLVNENPQALKEAFYTTLSFGTGGLRGIMGIGSNRMNIYTIKTATQGLANYINKQPLDNKDKKVFISFDSRNHSKEFAVEAAKVLTANQIKVYLFNELRPVPLVSFGIRFKGCIAGIMITASHNPKEYNGYKVYWNDGAQVLPPHDKGIIEEVNNISNPEEIKTTDIPNRYLEIIYDEVDLAYLSAVKKLQFNPSINQTEGDKLKIIYTSLYGAGITMVPKLLIDWGFTNLHFVEEQIKPNGNFPTTPRPNPEEKEALELGIKKLLEEKADLLIATDPDSDRMGVVSKNGDGYYIFNGNEIASICLEYICSTLTALKKMPANAAFVKTIVTTELFSKISAHYKHPCFNVLTGFKYIGELIRNWEQSSAPYQYIYGGEESFGTLLGTHARDKDAVIAAALISEVALSLKLQNKTLLDFLKEIYKKYGVFREQLLSLTFEGSQGVLKMKEIMNRLRTTPPSHFAGVPITQIDDIQRSLTTFFPSKTEKAIHLPQSDVLVFWLKDGSRLIIRPSGTEPKIKLYGEVYSEVKGSVDETINTLNYKVCNLLESLKNDLSS